MIKQRLLVGPFLGVIALGLVLCAPMVANAALGISSIVPAEVRLTDIKDGKRVTLVISGSDMTTVSNVVGTGEVGSISIVSMAHDGDRISVVITGGSDITAGWKTFTIVSTALGTQTTATIRVLDDTPVSGGGGGEFQTSLPIKQDLTQDSGGPTSIQGILDLIGSFGNILFAVFMSIALIFLVWGAMQFVMGGPTKMEEARGKMLWGAVGIGFALLSVYFDDILSSFLTNS